MSDLQKWLDEAQGFVPLEDDWATMYERAKREEENHRKALAALRAVVELHKKDCDNPDDDCGCRVCGGFGYPCPTIRAIEKEVLK
jgi:hypothetical protein